MVKVNGCLFGGKEFGNKEAIYERVNINHTENCIEMYFSDNRDITNMLMARAMIKAEAPESEVTLYMSYVPYSRMDREIGWQLCSIKYFAEIINAQEFTKVVALDPHSDVTVKSINRLELIDVSRFIKRAIQGFHPDVILFPDKGAFQRYTFDASVEQVLEGLPVIYGEKQRDLENRGAIVGYKLNLGSIEPTILRGARVLIVDDLCSRGGTFMLAAQHLKEAGASHIALYVSHCEQCILQGDILKTDLIEKVYTTTSIPQRIETINV